MISLSFIDPPLAGLFDEDARELLDECVPLVNRAAEIIHGEITTRLSRTGAPEPGEAPRRQVGALLASIITERAVRRGLSGVWGYVGSGYGGPFLEPGFLYAFRLEHGGADSLGRYMPAHPWFRPSIAAAGPKVDAMLQQEIEG
ncbi:MAG TPA: hypothetical protein VFJ16_24825 [Longimicrobium sp.]|nr:hypothetical protein [Longimicrobium sp.]